MLSLNVLFRAGTAPFRFWRSSLVLVLPYLAIWLLLRTIQVNSQQGSLKFGLAVCGLLGLSAFVSTTVAIAWHRTLLSPIPISLRETLRDQPRWRYLGLAALFLIGMTILSAAPAFGLSSLKWTLKGQELGVGWVSDLRFEFAVWLDRHAEQMVFSFFFAILAIGLPGVAIGVVQPYRETIRFSLRNLHHIFLASLAISLVLFAAERLVDEALLQARLRNIEIPAGLSVAPYLAIGLYAVFWGIGVLTEFHRAMRADQAIARMKAPQD